MTRRLLCDAAALAGGALEVTGDDHHYLFRVLRLTVGDTLAVFDGEGGEASARVAEITAERARLTLGERRRAAPPGPRLTSLVPLIKGDRMELALQKLTELGVDRIAPFAAARSVVRLEGARAAERVRRFQAVVRDAARQSRRATVPEVTPIGDLAAALAGATGDLRLVLAPEPGAIPLGRALAAGGGSAVILTGPEGGLSPAEVQAAAAAGFVAVSLGARILRAETAAIAGLALVGFALGAFDEPGPEAV